MLNNSVVFATAAPSIIPTGNEKGRKLSVSKVNQVCIQKHLLVCWNTWYALT